MKKKKGKEVQNFKTNTHCDIHVQNNDQINQSNQIIKKNHWIR